MNNDLNTFFTSEDKNDIKQSIKNIIINHFQSDLDQLQHYSFDPYKLDDLVNQCINEVFQEIKDELKDKIRVRMEKAFENFKLEDV